VIPVSVEGPFSFVLFAVWTLGLKPFPYVCAASTAIDLYDDLFQQRVVVMLGDFNSNAKWDKEHPASLNHSAMVSRLKRHGLISGYHTFKSEEHGEESLHTFHLHRNEQKKYHIDFCFVPESWAPRIRHVDIGSFAAWKTCSDHQPLLVDIDIDADA